MAKAPGVSVIIPVSRCNATTLEAMKTVCDSTNQLTGDKELLWCLEIGTDAAPLESLAARYPFTRILKREGARGMRFTRMQGIQESRYDTILFTDDDVWVDPSWAVQLHQLTLRHGVVSGPVIAHSRTTVYDELEELIDRYRAEAHTDRGTPKFVSFPNLGIQRTLLPPRPFDLLSNLYGNDMDLGCRIRAANTPIHIAQELAVRTEYPKTLRGVLRRKLVHAKGIAWTRRRMGPRRWKDLEIGDNWTVLLRWIGISLRAPVTIHHRLIYLLMNMTYCLGLFWYFNLTFRHVTELREEEIRNVPGP